jgi:hypothetical protein
MSPSADVRLKIFDYLGDVEPRSRVLRTSLFLEPVGGDRHQNTAQGCQRDHNGRPYAYYVIL